MGVLWVIEAVFLLLLFTIAARPSLHDSDPDMWLKKEGRGEIFAACIMYALVGRFHARFGIPKIPRGRPFKLGAFVTNPNDFSIRVSYVINVKKLKSFLMPFSHLHSSSIFFFEASRFAK